MSTLEVAGRKSLVLLSGGAYPELADEIAAHIGVTLTETTRRQFANGELFIRPNDSVRGTDVEGWVSRRDVLPHADLNMMGLLGSLGGGGPTIALASEAPLLVHTGGRVVRVGTARPGTFQCVKPASTDAREIELDFYGSFGGLGLGAFGSGPGSGPQPLEAKLFVAPMRGETCVEPAVRR